MTPARTTTDLIAYAEARGITIIWASDLPERARWIDGIHAILLRDGMTERRTVSTLAHELAHHHYGDICGADREARAWRWAARLLIPDHDYARAEEHHHSPGAIAQHLGIASLVAAALLLLASITGQLLYPLVPLLANELGMSYQTLPMLISIPSALLATIATALGIAALLVRDRTRTAAIIGTTLGASHLLLGLVGVLGVQLAGALLR